MKFVLLAVLNAGLIFFFIVLLRRKNLLFYSHGQRVWLTYLAVGVITFMDEFTSIFYAPAEAYRFIGLSAVVFIAITSLLVRFISTRLTEIAEILEHHNLIGGGVYSFSYLILGPMVSFVAVSSIMVDYILTACISAVSAVLNATSFFPCRNRQRCADTGHHLGRGRPQHHRNQGKCEIHLCDLYRRGLCHAQSHRLRPDRSGSRGMASASGGGGSNGAYRDHRLHSP